MKKSESALEKFNNGYNCAQSVLFALTEDLDFDSDTAMKIANGFGVGMGRMQEVCGAVTGGVMALGVIYGRGLEGGIERHENTYNKTYKLLRLFNEEFGSIHCKEILNGCNLLSDEGQQQFKELKLKDTCRKCVEWVVDTIERFE